MRDKIIIIIFFGASIIYFLSLSNKIIKNEKIRKRVNSISNLIWILALIFKFFIFD